MPGREPGAVEAQVFGLVHGSLERAAGRDVGEVYEGAGGGGDGDAGASPHLPIP
jgi:hypothetical protein